MVIYVAITWEELRGSLNITEAEEQVIELEKELIQTIVKVREEKD